MIMIELDLREHARRSAPPSARPEDGAAAAHGCSTLRWPSEGVPAVPMSGELYGRAEERNDAGASPALVVR